jgi:hypothetical protein
VLGYRTTEADMRGLIDEIGAARAEVPGGR